MDSDSTWPSARRKEHDAWRERRRAPLLGRTVADRIRERIVEHGLEPGTSMPSEAELADEFDVSLRIVRDAMRTLTNQGIIETRQGKRAMVANLRPVAVEDYFQFVLSSGAGAIEDLLDLRLAVETQAARVAATNVTPEQVEELRDLLDAVIAAGDDFRERAAADVEFHQAIARASGNQFFSGILEALDGALRDERGKGARLPRSHDLTNAQHVAVLEAIEARDPEAAERAMRVILVRARQLFEQANRGARDGGKRRARKRRSAGSS
jgi:DNA-binding FadR family transcriptional regulator